MNIVKFKDVVLTEENAPLLSQAQRELFNTKYKGKYTYAVDWLYCVPLEDMTYEQYVDVSRGLTVDEFGNIYTKITNMEELRNEEGSIDSSKEYVFMSQHTKNGSSKTYLPDLHSIKEDNVQVGYYPLRETQNRTFENKFIANNELDRILTAGPRFRFLPWKFYGTLGYGDRHIVTTNITLNDGGQYDDTTAIISFILTYYSDHISLRLGNDSKLVDNTQITKLYIPGSMLIQFGNKRVDYFLEDDYISYDEDYDWYYDSEDTKDDILNIPLQLLYGPGVTMNIYSSNDQIIGTETVENEMYLNFPIPKSLDPINEWLDDPDYFFIQDLNYKVSYEDEKGEKPKPEVLDPEYVYVTRSSNNVSYIYPNFLEHNIISTDKYRLDNRWKIEESELIAEGERRICFNLQFNDRFNLYNPSTQLLAVNIYRRDVVEPQLLEDFDYIAYDLLKDFVDIEITEQVNDVAIYKAANKYSTDSDITIGELKVFRTWLAQYLLSFDQDEEGKQQYKLFDDTVTHMLQYYSKDMYDDVIKYLTDFSSPLASFGTVTSACGCNSIGTIGGVVTQSYVQQNVLSKSNCGCDTSALTGNKVVNTCDPVLIYRKNIYVKMVETFSKIDFWSQFSKLFIQDFKKYVDNILSENLPLTTSSLVSVFADCGCLTQADAEQQKNQAILRDLSKSLQYIIDDQISGHKNFIADTLTQWSSKLYEIMYWK